MAFIPGREDIMRKASFFTVQVKYHLLIEVFSDSHSGGISHQTGSWCILPYFPVSFMDHRKGVSFIVIVPGAFNPVSIYWIK